MLKQRVITAVVMIIVCVGVFFFASSQVFELCMAIVAAAAAFEWARLSGCNEKHSQITSLIVGLLALLIKTFLAGTVFVLFAATLALLFWVYALRKLIQAPVRMSVRGADWFRVTQGAGLILVTVICMQSLRFDAPHASPWLLLYCLALVWVMDTGAYFAGRRFGRVKLAPKISPGKTREGVVGGVAAACSLFLITALFANWPQGSLFTVFLASVIAAPFSVVGDLYESRMKRAAGAKDSSNLLPGHGGVLDRIDGLLATVQVFTAVYLWTIPAP